MTSDRPRDRAIDAVRAVAMVGVVGGHWLVTGLRLDGEGAWRQASPLAAMPDLAPVSWGLQTLGLFFFAGGFAAVRSMGRRSGPRGARRLMWPVAGLLGFWAVVLGIAAATGTPTPTLRTIAVLVISPLWFLLPYLGLRMMSGPLARIVGRAGPWVIALPAIGIVAVSDMGRAPIWLAVPAAWSVPWVLGIALAQDRTALIFGRVSGTPGTERPPNNNAGVPVERSSGTPARMRSGLGLLLVGAGAMAVLIGACGYPVSAVGVPGDGRSNLSPPSLLAVALALAQIGVFLLIRDRPRPAVRLTGRPGRLSGSPARLAGSPGRLVGSLNRAALPIFLSHQSVLIAVAATSSAILGRPAPGLLTAPADPWWIMQRVAWLPFLALVLAAVIKPRSRTTRRASLP